MDFGGRVVMVTGGTGYLGSAVCKAFRDAGADVVAVYLLEKELPYFRKILGAGAKQITLEKADVSRRGEMDRVVAKVFRRHGRIDVLVNTVGGFMASPVDEISSEDFEAAMAINLKSAFLACKAVISAMRRRKRGKIVNVSSQASLLGEAESFLYSASKSGINRLTEALAAELKDVNVQVNCIMPSIMDTPTNRKAMPDADFSKWVKTDQAAQIILWLCSEVADPISGASIPVYGRV